MKTWSKALGGMKPDQERPGFKNILLEPHFVKGLNSFEASHEGPNGKIQSSWKRSKNTVNYQVTIPANSTATLKLTGKKISQNGKVIFENSGKLLNQFITVNLESGRNEFVVFL